MIDIFITGGTFDKEYDYVKGTLYFKNTHLPQMLQTGRSTLDVEVRTLMMVDSLDMTEEDRELIAFQCERSDAKGILITHGTDTMVETARYLAAKEINNTIVITGALVPYAFGGSSDGFFNLGAALAFAQTLDKGVYIAMNGRYFEWNKVRKNRSTGFFEDV